MAEVTSSDFKKLIEAQQETTRQLMSVEERAADDAKKAEINQKRVEGGRKAWQTRQARSAEKANTADAADTEDEGKAAKKDSKMLGYLKSTAGFLGGIVKSGTEKVKSGASSMFSILKKLAIGGLAIAALAFLQSPKFEEIKNQIIDVIVPKLAVFYDKVLVPIGKALVKLFSDVMGYLCGENSLMSVLTENKLAIAGIVTLLAPGAVFGALLGSVKLLIKGLAWAGAKAGIFAKIGTAFTALKTFFTATLLPAITGLGFGAIIGIVAGIGAAIWAIYKSVQDAYDEFCKTGSYWEAAKTFLVSFIANFVGIIPDLVKKALSWIIKKIGGIFGIEHITGPIVKAMDNFSFIECITSSLIWVGNWIASLFEFGTPEKPFSLSKFVGEAWEKLLKLFTGLLDIDFKKMVSDLIPEGKIGDLARKALGIGGGTESETGKGKQDEMAEAAQAAEKQRQEEEEKRIKVQRLVMKRNTIKLRNRQRLLKGQQAEIKGGDEFTGFEEDSLFGATGRRRSDVVKKLQLEIAQIKRERAALKSGAGTSIVSADTNVNAPSNTHFSTNVTSLTNTDSVTNALSAADG